MAQTGRLTHRFGIFRTVQIRRIPYRCTGDLLLVQGASGEKHIDNPKLACSLFVFHILFFPLAPSPREEVGEGQTPSPRPFRGEGAGEEEEPT